MTLSLLAPWHGHKRVTRYVSTHQAGGVPSQVTAPRALGGHTAGHLVARERASARMDIRFLGLDAGRRRDAWVVTCVDVDVQCGSECLDALMH